MLLVVDASAREYAPIPFNGCCAAKRRALYDQHGEKGLKEGVSNGAGGVIAGWAFNKSPDTVFAEFFGTASAFSDVALFTAADNKEPKKPEAEPVPTPACTRAFPC